MKLVKVENHGCNPCKVMDLILNGLGANYEKVNVGDNEAFALEYDIMKVPQLLLFDENGIVVERVIGIEDQDKIAELVNKTK